MYTEHRRRYRQNECFERIKDIVPSAPKMDRVSLLGETVEYIKSLKQRLKQLEELNVALRSDDIKVVPSGLYSPTQDMTQAVPEDENTLRIEVVRNDCSQEDAAIDIFTCLRDMNLTVNHASVSTDVYRIHATIKAKMPNDSSSDQLTLCSEIQDALQRCLP
ncbi:hypothetical protein R1flu_028627 [Riccia fluitans]|uniref:BHLH domain-containing protein n=1 Tax=Riccia fluitans TaxID=41844 RepID=A0ABD1XM93_9MARC